MKEFEKVFELIVETLRKAERLLVVADNRPDGDCIGSSTALYQWLKREGKNVTLFYNGDLPQQFRFVDSFHDFVKASEVFDEKYDVIVTVDGGDLEHIGINELLPHAPKGYTLINIDHHSTNSFFGDLNLVDTNACSTCEVVYRMFEHCDIHFDDKMATSLLTGLCTDTGHFSNAATNSIGMDAAGKLCRFGARHTDILKHLVTNKSIPSVKLLGLALERLQYNEMFDMASTYFVKEDFERLNADEEDARGIVEFLNATCGHADSIMLLKDPRGGVIKGTFRSMNRDISKLAESFGGGGHKKAAGFQVPGRIEIIDGKAKIVAAE